MKGEKSTYSEKEAGSQAGLGEPSCPQASLRNERNSERTKKDLKHWSKGEKGLRKFTKQSVREGLEREPCWAEGLRRSTHLRPN